MKKKTVAVIGIDGVGKTSIIKEIIKKLEQEGKSSSVFYMGLGRDFRIPFLKNLIRIYSNLRYRDYGKIRKNGSKIIRDNYRIRSFPWIFIQYLEFWFRYLKARSEKINYIFFDRYFYDGLILADKKSFNFFKVFTPKPDFCFLIYAPPEFIIKRKKEAEIKNIKDFYNKDELLKKYFKIETVDNTRDIKIVVDEILEKII